VKYLIEKGADVNAKNKSGWTALHFASSEGQLKIVQCLMEEGANINAEDKSKMTALNLARKNVQLEVVQYLSDFTINYHLEHLTILAAKLAKMVKQFAK
jgi:ankyrin repeat protein